MELKKILIASAIFNVFIVICFASLAAHCSGKYYALNNMIREQNKTISGQNDYEKVCMFNLNSLKLKF